MAKSRRKSQEPGPELDVLALMRLVEAERQHRGLTYQEVAAQLFVCYDTLCYWRRGGPSIGGSAAMRVACWLDVDLRDFVVQPADQPATQEVA